MNQTSIKICYIGGGSRYWAKMVMTDLALQESLTGEISLYDIDYNAAVLNEKVAGELFEHPDSKTSFKVKAFKDVKAALKGADFVFMSILPGPMQMMANDLDIPAKYGVLQTVGDTMGPGGISRALRSAPVYMEYAHIILECCPKAWVINYTNPMTLCTATLFAAEPDIKAFGCCHEVFGIQKKLAEIYASVTGETAPHRREIKLDIAGVNHFTFATSASYREQDLFPILDQYLEGSDVWNDHSKWAKDQVAKGEVFPSRNRVAFEFYRKYGVLGAAGDRHLVEFVPWYLESVEKLYEHGVLLTPSSYRLGNWKAAANAPGAELADGKRDGGLQHSGEEGIDQIMALMGLGDLDTNVNLINVGQMPQFENGIVVETNAEFRKDSLKPLPAKTLPESLKPLLDQVIETQKATLDACLNPTRDRVVEAMKLDPLVNLDEDKLKLMVGELLEANRSLLPETLFE